MWVKICGVRDEQTAEAVCQLLPDAIGLNFYAKSPRSVSKDMATRISKQMPAGVLRVGVFVNHSINEIEDLANVCSLDWIQLHGDEPAEQIAELHDRLPSLPLLRAWRTAGDDLRDLSEYLRTCQSLGVSFTGCLIDSRVVGSYGGTGHTVSWSALNTSYRRDIWPPLILAGGLTPENVSAAIQATAPWGVDVASGVESPAGVKDLEQVRRFIANARSSQTRADQASETIPIPPIR